MFHLFQKSITKLFDGRLIEGYIEYPSKSKIQFIVSGNSLSFIKLKELTQLLRTEEISFEAREDIVPFSGDYVDSYISITCKKVKFV